METGRMVLGIDVSKSDFHVCLKESREGQVKIRGSHKFENSPGGFKALDEWLSARNGAYTSVHSVMEATGVYHEDLAHFLFSREIPVSIELPNRIKYFAKSINLKTKTDKVDAAMIASYGLERSPVLWYPMSDEYFHARQLCRELLQFKKDMTRCKNQLHALQHARETMPLARELKEKHLKFLEQTIKQIEQEIILLSKQDENFSRKVERLETIPGMGRITIMIILCETNGFGAFHNTRQLTSFAGLDVIERQSGIFKGKTRISKKGNKYIRQCLYMPAMTACRFNKPIKELNERIIEKNPGFKRKGIVAGMRKLLILNYILWKKEQDFDLGYKWKKE